MADNVIDPDSKDYKDYLEYDGLKGEEIPIEARIVALADRYDALRSPRQYKPQFSHEKTCAILETDDRLNITGEEWFGKQVWDVFVQNKAEFDKIYSSKNINPIKKAVGAN
jgi:HD-GYP domain-containing protein (c-di-GMP phosphodiesterase class II)